MFRRLRTGRTRWVFAAVALALPAATGLTIASPAHAETLPIVDGFETGGWTTEGVAGKTSAAVGTFTGPHSGSALAFLDAYPNAPAEARVFRAITLNNGAPLPGTCRASVYLHVFPILPPEGTPLPPIQDNVQVFLKVHSGGPTGQLISAFGYNLRQAGWGTAPLAFAPIPWPGSSRTVTVEIAAYRGVAAADDLTFSC
jgi:hypothetical protein